MEYNSVDTFAEIMKNPGTSLRERLQLRRVEKGGVLKRFPKLKAMKNRISGKGAKPKNRDLSDAAGHDFNAGPENARPHKGEHDGPEALKKKHDDAAKKAKEAENDAKNPKSDRMAAFTALGITAAVAAAIAAASLANYIASDGATLNFSSIDPKKTIVSWFPGLGPTKLDITWSVGHSNGISSDVQVNVEDTIDISGTGIDLIDGKTVTVTKIVGTNIFEIDTGKDTSNATGSTGTGILHTTFETNFVANTDAAAAAAGNAVNEGAGAFLSGLMPILLPILIFGGLFFFLYMIISSIR